MIESFSLVTWSATIVFVTFDLHIYPFMYKKIVSNQIKFMKCFYFQFTFRYCLQTMLITTSSCVDSHRSLSSKIM